LVSISVTQSQQRRPRQRRGVHRSGCWARRAAVQWGAPALGGLPEGTPERPEVQPAYPAVHDMPPQRATAILTDAQLKQERDELVAAREKQLTPPPPPPRKPAPKRPARPPEDAGTTRNP
jgi:hypothetical protein